MTNWMKEAEEIQRSLAASFERIGQVVEANQRKVLQAFRSRQVSDFHFQEITGYGYDDSGREVLEQVYADVFGAEAALVRPQFVSGTHAISTALFGLLRPGQELLYITGAPYDTLEEVIGIRSGVENQGTLKDFDIKYDQVPLRENNIDIPAVLARIRRETRVVGIQRSRGYDDRRSIPIEEIREAVAAVKKKHPHVYVFVDNCYGEFVEREEPPAAGADITAGSLIKNPGGGLVRTGSYLAGTKEAVDRCAYALTAPGIGAEGGASLGILREMFQGLFLAPHTVGEAWKGAEFTAALLQRAGMETDPAPGGHRTDLIQSVSFPEADTMIAFCQEIQAGSPIDAHVRPQPSYMPGYEHDVIMAAGTFIQGASIELSADGPLRPPYRAYIQGGLTFEHVKIAVLDAVIELDKSGKI
ncbi:aminotransferase class I/II-fold pyridoxal phosphate-dependent enzyme [Alkalicoccus chagannorensis]|uniref:methionine gamma-lyase family protein n=1 Tax=Alkalicoccus chagannorensis TaxID=427072 RepID=UPI00040439E6|nr:methionine gamma-lyase family protein [Alkalicoccus chagannorensis]